MQGEYYRLNTPSLAIKNLPNRKRIPVTVPKGAVVKGCQRPTRRDATRVDVEWEGEVVMMFLLLILRERGTLVAAASAGVAPQHPCFRVCCKSMPLASCL